MEDNKSHIDALQYQLRNRYNTHGIRGRRYTGKEPCPCCKRVVSRGSKNSPCYDCQQLLKRSVAFARSQEGISGEYVKMDLPAYNLNHYYSIPEELRSHDRQYRSGSLPYFSESDHPDYNSKTLLKYWNDLLISLHVEGLARDKVVGHLRYDGTTKRAVVVRKETATGLLDFYSYIGEMMYAVERRGKEAGQNWIAGLIEGDLDPNKFLR